MLDISKSIGQRDQRLADKNFRDVTTFISNVVQFLNISLSNSLVGVVQFARWADIKFNVSYYANKSDLLHAINSLKYGNITDVKHETTNTPNALNLLKTAGQEGGKLGLRYDLSTTHIAVIITDGRANTHKRTGNRRRKDDEDTEIAARDLHEANVYDQIYCVGIRGKRDEIDTKQLEVIASDPSLTFILDDFTEQTFEELLENLTSLVCRRKSFHYAKYIIFIASIHVASYNS